MNKYTYTILGLCIASFVFLGIMLTRQEVDTEDNIPVDLSVDYTNGTHLGYINSFKNESGRTYLSIDFLQAFVSKKGSFMASVEDRVCSLESMQQHIRSQFPNEVNKKTVAEVLSFTEIPQSLVQLGKMNDEEITEIARMSGCFPNGINYTRNRSTVERERSVSPAFTSTLNGQVVTYENIVAYLKAEKAKNSSPLTYMITLKEGVVTKLDVAQK